MQEAIKEVTKIIVSFLAGNTWGLLSAIFVMMMAKRGKKKNKEKDNEGR